MNEFINDEADFEPEDVEYESGETIEEDEHRSRFDGFKQRGRDAIAGAAEIGREKLYEAADRGKGRLADVLDSAADRLDYRLASGATYLRSRDPDAIRADLSEQIRRHPLLSAGIALGAGYVIGKAIAHDRGLRGRSQLRRKIGKRVRRAVISGIGAMVAERVRESFAQQDEPPEEDDDIDDSDYRGYDDDGEYGEYSD